MQYYLLLVIFIFFTCFYAYLINEDIKTRKIDISKMTCISQEKTYITDYNNYHYYSDCNYGDNTIKIGNMNNLSLKFFIDNNYLNDDYEKQFKISKKKIITNIVVNKNNNGKRLINSHDGTKAYFYNIDSIIVTQDGIDYNYEEYLKDKKLREHLRIELNWSTELTYVHPNHKYDISVGKYYNQLGCTVGSRFDGVSNSYTLPLDYKITENSCKELESLPKN